MWSGLTLTTCIGSPSATPDPNAASRVTGTRWSPVTDVFTSTRPDIPELPIAAPADGLIDATLDFVAETWTDAPDAPIEAAVPAWTVAGAALIRVVAETARGRVVILAFAATLEDGAVDDVLGAGTWTDVVDAPIEADTPACAAGEAALTALVVDTLVCRLVAVTAAEVRAVTAAPAPAEATAFVPAPAGAAPGAAALAAVFDVVRGAALLCAAAETPGAGADTRAAAAGAAFVEGLATAAPGVVDAGALAVAADTLAAAELPPADAEACPALVLAPADAPATETEVPALTEVAGVCALAVTVLPPELVGAVTPPAVKPSAKATVLPIPTQLKETAPPRRAAWAIFRRSPELHRPCPLLDIDRIRRE